MTPIRLASAVDQLQKIVAKPTAIERRSRAISCTPSRSGSAISARESASSDSSLGVAS